MTKVIKWLLQAGPAKPVAMPCRTYPDPRWIGGTDNCFNVRDLEPEKASREGTPFIFAPVYWVGFTVVAVRQAFASAVVVGPELLPFPVFAPGRTAAAPLVVPVPQLAGTTG